MVRLTSLVALMTLVSLVSLVGLVCGVSRVSLMRLMRLMGLMGLLLLVMCLLLSVVLMLLLVRLLRLLLLLLAWMPGMRLVGGMRLLLVLLVLRVLRVREDVVVLNGLVDAAGEHHGGRVRLGLHLLPRRRGALSLDVDGIGDVVVWSSRRLVAAAVDGRLGEEMLRVGALRRLLLRRIGLGLVGRRGMGGGRLLVCLVLIRVRGCEAGIAAEAGLGEVQAGVRVGAGWPEARHRWLARGGRGGGAVASAHEAGTAAGSGDVAGEGVESRRWWAVAETRERDDNEPCRLKRAGLKQGEGRPRNDGSRRQVPMERGKKNSASTYQAPPARTRPDFLSPPFVGLKAGRRERWRRTAEAGSRRLLADSRFPRVEQATVVRRGPARLKQNPGPGFFWGCR